jgi:hypothetical protein
LSLLVSRLVECRLESTTSKGLLLGTISRDILKTSIYPSLNKGINVLSNGKLISEFHMQLQTTDSKERDDNQENIATISIDDMVELMVISMWLQDKELLVTSLCFFMSISSKSSLLTRNSSIDIEQDNINALYSDLNFISSLKWILLHTSYLFNGNDINSTISINNKDDNILKVQILHKINHFLSIRHLDDELIDITNIFQNCIFFINQCNENSSYFIAFNRFCSLQQEKYKNTINMKKEKKRKTKIEKENKNKYMEQSTTSSGGFNFSNSNSSKSKSTPSPSSSSSSSSSSSDTINSALDMFDMTPSIPIKATRSSGGFNFSNSTSSKTKSTPSPEQVKSALDMF